MTNGKNCACSEGIERLDKEIEALREELEGFEKYVMELIDALTETGNRCLGFDASDCY